MKIFYSKKAFTLVEIITVITILGVVAAIIIPNAIKSTTEKSNKTKVAKAITTYDRLIQTFIIENNLQVSTSILNKLGRYNKMTLPNNVASRLEYTKGLQRGSDEYNAALSQRDQDLQAYDNEINSGECENIRKYFKISTYSFKDKRTNRNITMSTKCMFKAGGLWWDVTNISKTIIATIPEVLTDEEGNKNVNIDDIALNYDDKRAFYLNTIQDKNGSYLTNNATKNDSVEVQIQNFKAYDYAFNKSSITYLPCTKTRTKSCTNSGNIGYSYKNGKPAAIDLSHKNEKGEYDEYYRFCSSNSVDTCKCKYVKVNDVNPSTANKEVYMITQNSLDTCLAAINDYNKEIFGIEPMSKVCAYITYDKNDSEFSESNYDPTVKDALKAMTTSYCPYSYDTRQAEDSWMNNMIRQKWEQFNL